MDSALRPGGAIGAGGGSGAGGGAAPGDGALRAGDAAAPTPGARSGRRSGKHLTCLPAGSGSAIPQKVPA